MEKNPLDCDSDIEEKFFTKVPYCIDDSDQYWYVLELNSNDDEKNELGASQGIEDAVALQNYRKIHYGSTSTLASSQHISDEELISPHYESAQQFNFFQENATCTTLNRKKLNLSLSSSTSHNPMSSPALQQGCKSFNESELSNKIRCLSLRNSKEVLPIYRGFQLIGDSQFLRFSQQLLSYEMYTSLGVSQRKLGFCVSGQRVRMLERRLQRKDCPLGDKVLVLIGTNDFLQNTSIERMCNYYKSLVSYLKENTQVIILLTVPPIPKLSGEAEHWIKLKRLNDFILGLREEGKIYCFDLASLYISYNNTTSLDYFEKHYIVSSRTDLVHLNILGFRLLKAHLDIFLEHNKFIKTEIYFSFNPNRIYVAITDLNGKNSCILGYHLEGALFSFYYRMTKDNSELIISSILVISTGILFIVNRCISLSQLFNNPNSEYSWVVFGFQNVLGYSTVFIPGYIIYAYINKTNYLDKVGNSYLAVVLRKCFQGDEVIERSNAPSSNLQTRTLFQDACLLLFYFVCLQISFLTWGVLQEKVMTQEYSNGNGEIGHFTDSQFLVFVNRILAFGLSGIVISCTRQPRHKAPFYKYVFCSLSNIFSSWCQYEALKYVSFLHQVLAKAAKTIPVMIMGKFISKTKYDYYEYVAAIILSIGMLFFMLDTGNDRKGSTTVTTLSGVILLCSYIAFDSFTSNWQGSLFKQYGMKPVQMMCGVNMFSCIFTAISLMQHGGFVKSLSFMLNFPRFIFDCVLISLCSAAGQLFIYKTIASFGPLVFVIITTIRQGFSVLLSCIIYKHQIHTWGVIGILLVFFSIFLRIYCGYRLKVKRKRAQNVSDLKI